MLNRVSKAAAGEDHMDFMDVENLTTRGKINIYSSSLKGKTCRYHGAGKSEWQEGRQVEQPCERKVRTSFEAELIW